MAGTGRGVGAQGALLDAGRTLARARYAAAQSARVAWYMGHYVLARRLSGPFDRPGEPRFASRSPEGAPTRIRQAFFDVFAKDRANIEAGLYPAPNDVGVQQALSALRDSARFFQDLPKVDARRLQRRGVEVRDTNAAQRYPAYYLQNFHYQTGGWLTRESAALYDTQVEVLFGGAADAMRRIALGELAAYLRGRDQRRVRVLDAACGNGRFLSQILGAFPKLNVTGLDLSPAYADEARARLRAWPQADIAVGAIEHAPFDDARFDAVTCVYLFHELPPKVRRQAAAEFARLLKPGGALVFADSLQRGDAPDLDRMLDYFPHGFHEPFYASYQDEDFPALFAEAGLQLETTNLAFLTKVMRFRRV
ncbi:MAG: methyltransferase domain-containing protein [Alphaproteobacteria bacterium]|nr:methyltransferase domain-containing protein [Alphaproteobacteria bacterium]